MSYEKIRCSVFPVFIDSETNDKYIIMFLDKENMEITNAGGMNFAEETYLQAMSRELQEESRCMLVYSAEELKENTLFSMKTNFHKSIALNISDKFKNIDELMNFATEYDNDFLYRSEYENHDYLENEKMIIYSLSELETMAYSDSGKHVLWKFIKYLTKIFVTKLKAMQLACPKD